jgi:hypothetical protein
VVLLIMARIFVTAMQRNREEAIRALLEFGRRLLKSLRVYIPQRLPFSRDLSISTLSNHLLFCILLVVRVDTYDPSAVVTLLAKHVGDCDGEGFEAMHVNMQQG